MCVGRCSRQSSVHTVVVYGTKRRLLLLPSSPSNSLPPSALTEPVNQTCQQPIGGELLQGVRWTNHGSPGVVREARPERQEELAAVSVGDRLCEEWFGRLFLLGHGSSLQDLHRFILSPVTEPLTVLTPCTGRHVFPPHRFDGGAQHPDLA